MFSKWQLTLASWSASWALLSLVLAMSKSKRLFTNILRSSYEHTHSHTHTHTHTGVSKTMLYIQTIHKQYAEHEQKNKERDQLCRMWHPKRTIKCHKHNGDGCVYVFMSVLPVWLCIPPQWNSSEGWESGCWCFGQTSSLFRQTASEPLHTWAVPFLNTKHTAV